MCRKPSIPRTKRKRSKRKNLAIPMLVNPLPNLPSLHCRKWRKPKGIPHSPRNAQSRYQCRFLRKAANKKRPHDPKKCRHLKKKKNLKKRVCCSKCTRPGRTKRTKKTEKEQKVERCCKYVYMSVIDSAVLCSLTKNKTKLKNKKKRKKKDVVMLVLLLHLKKKVKNPKQIFTACAVSWLKPVLCCLHIYLRCCLCCSLLL